MQKAVRNLYEPGSQNTERRSRLAARLAAQREPAASLRPYADIPPGVVILNATTGTIRRITLRGGWRLRADRAIGGG